MTRAARFTALLQGRVRRLVKADASPVTLGDLGGQALVSATLAAASPDPLMGEEKADRLRAEPALLKELESLLRDAGEEELSGAELCAAIDRGHLRAPCDRFWVVDPIDGTKGFLRDENYTVGLALVVEGEVRVAAMACPRYRLPGAEREGARFLALEGQGAWSLPLEGESRAPLRVSERVGAEARLTSSVERAHSDPEATAGLARSLGLKAPPLLLDSMLKYAVVAAGSAELYVRAPRSGYTENLWDHAPGILLVEEAGGRVSGAEGQGLRCDTGAALHTGGLLLASNGLSHEQALAALRESS